MIIMISAMVFVFIGGTCLGLSQHRENTIGEWVSSIFFALLISTVIIGICVGTIVMLIFSNIVPTEMEDGWGNEIVSMKDNNAYVISRHHVEQSDRYYYMVKYNGYYKSHWVKQGRSRIYEVDNGPYVIKTIVQVRKPRNWIERDMTRILKRFYDGANLSNEYEFYVPKGSVMQEFRLDME